jgi:amino acid transporter
MTKVQRWTRRDQAQVGVMVLITVNAVFCIMTVRGVPLLEGIGQIVRLLIMCVLYGFGTVYLFIGVTKKTLKYEPTSVKIVKWAFGLAAFFAVSQLLHEVVLAFIGQEQP